MLKVFAWQGNHRDILVLCQAIYVLLQAFQDLWFNCGGAVVAAVPLETQLTFRSLERVVNVLWAPTWRNGDGGDVAA